MKKMMLCLMLISSGVFGQNEMKTLWGKSNAKISQVGIYVAPEMQYGQFDGKFQPFVGNSLMLQFNQQLAIGVTGFCTVNDNTATTTSLRGGFGGLKLEYTPKPTALVHVSFPLMIGGGTTSMGGFGKGNFDGMGRKGKHGSYANTMYSKSDSLRTEGFVVQPGVAIEANLFRYAKVFAGANYRLGFASGYSSTMSGLSASAGIKVGVFDYTLGKRERRGKSVRHNKKDK